MFFHPRLAHAWWLLAAAAIPLCLLWDFSWESTIGIDLPSSPPHVALDITIGLAAFAALALLRPASDAEGVRFLGRRAPLGAWVTLWGALAFVTGAILDVWWQSSYGLAAGLWPPPQWLKTVAFLAIVIGVWLHVAGRSGSGFAIAGGTLLALLSVLTLPWLYPNRQHLGAFYLTGAALYPLVLVAQARLGGGQWPATLAALSYLGMWAAMVWLLPLFPGEPQVAPIFHARTTMLPPPFALLLPLPALAVDLAMRQRASVLQAGLGFAVAFVAAQWVFSGFLLSPAAAGWVFAGGGKQWPFFLQIAPGAETQYWRNMGSELNAKNGVMVLLVAVISARLGEVLAQARRSSAP